MVPTIEVFPSDNYRCFPTGSMVPPRCSESFNTTLVKQKTCFIPSHNSEPPAKLPGRVIYPLNHLPLLICEWIRFLIQICPLSLFERGCQLWKMLNPGISKGIDIIFKPSAWANASCSGTTAAYKEDFTTLGTSRKLFNDPTTLILRPSDSSESSTDPRKPPPSGEARTYSSSQKLSRFMSLFTLGWVLLRMRTNRSCNNFLAGKLSGVRCSAVMQRSAVPSSNWSRTFSLDCMAVRGCK